MRTVYTIACAPSPRGAGDLHNTRSPPVRVANRADPTIAAIVRLRRERRSPDAYDDHLGFPHRVQNAC